MRFTNQYFWHIIFIFLFILYAGYATYFLRDRLLYVTPFEFIILSLATFRLTRLMVYDRITAFFREQFYNLKGGKLVEPERGPRRALNDLVTCPWCFGLWAGATVVFCYYLTPLSWFPILFLAIAGLGAFFQILANMIGWKAEQLKEDVK